MWDEIIKSAAPIALGAALTVLGTFLQSYLQNRHALNVMQKQWDREDTRSKQEAEDKRKERKQDLLYKERTELLSAYSGGMSNVV